MPRSRRRRKAFPSCRCAGLSAPTCSRIARTGRSSTIRSGTTIRSCCCRRSSPMSRCSTRRLPTAMAMSGSAATASSLPWRMPPRRRWSRWRSFTTETGSMIPRSMPARSAASTCKPSRWRRRALGRSGLPTTTARTRRTSPTTRAWLQAVKDLPPISTGTCMPSAPRDASRAFRDEELLAGVIAGLIGDAPHVALGASSPIPAAAALLARARGDGRPQVSLLGSRRQSFFTDGGRELFDCAGQGRIDVSFLSGGQIDGAGNINLVGIGDYAHPTVRFPGSFGSSYLYYVVPKVILFRLEHSRRTLVEKVDFISAPGTSPDNGHRPRGPPALVTPRCLFPFDSRRRRFELASVHPGHTIAEVVDNTGFKFDRPADVAVTPAPSAETLRLLRTVVAPQLTEVYPRFAAEVFGMPQKD